jgi:spoIIIJ-associated protein
MSEEEVREFEGENLEEVLGRASDSLGIDPKDLDFEVMQEGRRGFLGVGGRGVVIRVRTPEATGVHPSSVAVATGGAEADEGVSGIDAEKIEEFLRQFAAASPFEIEFGLSGDAENIRIDLDGKDRELFLARKGEGLNALQVILGRIASQAGSSRTVFLDCGDFRKSREEELAEIALLTAEKVKKLGESQSLSPMNPYERRLVHLALKDDPAVETRSEGEGFIKSVTIYPRES